MARGITTSYITKVINDCVQPWHFRQFIKSNISTLKSNKIAESILLDRLKVVKSMLDSNQIEYIDDIIDDINSDYYSYNVKVKSNVKTEVKETPYKMALEIHSKLLEMEKRIRLLEART